MVDPDFVETYSRLQLLKDDPTANLPERDFSADAPEACSIFDAPEVSKSPRRVTYELIMSGSL